MMFWFLTIVVLSGTSGLARFAFPQIPILSVVFPLVSGIVLMAATLVTVHRRTVTDEEPKAKR